MRPITLKGHKEAVNEIAISQSGSFIASCSNDKTVRIWTNTAKGDSTVIKNHLSQIRTVDLSSDSKLLATGSNDKSIKITMLSIKKVCSIFNDHTNWVRSVRFSPNITSLVSCSDDHNVKLWDITKSSLMHNYLDHIKEVNTVRFSPDGNCIASGSSDNTIRLHDIRTGRLTRLFESYAINGSITCLSYHYTGDYLISSSMDGSIKIWDIRMGIPLYSIQGNKEAIYSIAFSPCGEFFCSGGSDSMAVIYKSNFPFSISANNDKGVNSKKAKSIKGLRKTCNKTPLGNELSAAIGLMSKMNDIISTVSSLHKHLQVIENKVELFKIDNKASVNLNINSNVNGNIEDNNDIGQHYRSSSKLFDMSDEQKKKNPIEIFEDISNHIEEFN